MASLFLDKEFIAKNAVEIYSDKCISVFGFELWMVRSMLLPLIQYEKVKLPEAEIAIA
ncbi:hypothetical protein [Erwinia mallotivora]|uniref:hypothetical protein n=1 Tax=Erwinia mallotivora TaxID=69222 RepID=UPI001362222A|nr:hypothetical protein [Erwinia mallotivora]